MRLPAVIKGGVIASELSSVTNIEQRKLRLVKHCLGRSQIQGEGVPALNPGEHVTDQALDVAGGGSYGTQSLSWI